MSSKVQKLMKRLIKIYKFLINMEKSGKTKTIFTGVKIVYTLILIVAMIGILIVAYVMKGKWNIVNLGFADLGVYGLIIFVYTVIQQILSITNNNYWIPKLVSKAKKMPKTNIQVVGYLQDPKLFFSCLASLSQQEYGNLGQIIVGIDGNQENDMSMANVFKKIYPEGKLIVIDKIYLQLTEEQKANLKQKTFKQKFVCIAQPHKGKRQIMYTCMQLHDSTTQMVALTDSDTMWNKDTLSRLVEVMVGHDDYREEMNSRQPKCWRSKVSECGSVTGDVGIWNEQNYLSYLSSLRYWFAFNVERAADSFFGVVNCVSGPLGLYKREQLQEISHKWIEQEFMGDKCTFGDDRHLSNLILEKGLSIFYTPFAACKTDTPAQLLRWIPQQTRWCKSFFREFFYNIKSFHKHSIWMSVELVFQFIYPFFLIVTLVWFITLSLNVLLIIFSFVVIMAFFRCLFAVFRTGRPEFLHVLMYVFLYIFFLIPSKLWGFITVWNTEWGTSSRLARYSNILRAIHALIWAFFFSAFLIFFICKFVFFDKMTVDTPTYAVAAASLGLVLLLVLHWTIWGRGFLVPRVKEQLQEKYQNYKSYIKRIKDGYAADSSKSLVMSNDIISHSESKQTM